MTKNMLNDDKASAILYTQPLKAMLADRAIMVKLLIFMIHPFVDVVKTQPRWLAIYRNRGAVGDFLCGRKANAGGEMSQ